MTVKFSEILKTFFPKIDVGDVLKESRILYVLIVSFSSRIYLPLVF